MEDALKDILGWGSPIGLGFFFIALAIASRLTAGIKGKRKHKEGGGE